jgi:hypothetical protein
MHSCSWLVSRYSYFNRDGMHVEVTSDINVADREIVLEGMRAFNASKAQDTQSDPLAIWVKEDGKVLGGLIGRTWVRWLSIEVLWLPERVRSLGLGTEIICRAEAEAQRRGCLGAYLET